MMRRMEIDAHLFSFMADDEAECFVLALGEDEESVFILQLAYEFDAQDVDSNCDTYCLVLPDGATFYGGIQQCELGETQLHIQLTQEAADALDATEIEINLRLSATEKAALADALAVIFTVPKDKPKLIPSTLQREAN